MSNNCRDKFKKQSDDVDADKWIRCPALARAFIEEKAGLMEMVEIHPKQRFVLSLIEKTQFLKQRYNIVFENVSIYSQKYKQE